MHDKITRKNVKSLFVVALAFSLMFGVIYLMDDQLNYGPTSWQALDQCGKECSVDSDCGKGRCAVSDLCGLHCINLD